MYQIFGSILNKRNTKRIQAKTENIAAKRLLVEGEPGIGKSTLCQKLALGWAMESCKRDCIQPCIHSFDIVVYLQASDFEGFTSVSAAVCANLLSQNSGISERALDEVMSCENTLVIVDAYDQAHECNSLLKQFIQKKVFPHSTLLLTSRPNYLTELTKEFDALLTLDGFNQKQRKEFVANYARNKKMSPEEFKGVFKNKDIQDLFSTPLNVTIVCMLCSNGENHAVSTRTEVHRSLHNFISRKASRRLEMSEDQLNKLIIRPLCKLSFAAYKRGDVSFTENELKVECESPELMCQGGYLIRKMKISLLDKADVRYSYSHQSFQEFLAAMHLVTGANPEETLEWFQRKDTEYNQSINSFALGLLDPVQLACSIMDTTLFSQMHCLPRYHYTDCPRSHIIMRIMQHLFELTKGRAAQTELETAFVRKCPPLIFLSRNCSQDCLLGTSKIFTFKRHRPKTISLRVDCDARLNYIQILSSLSVCESVNSVELVNSHNLEPLLRAMRPGQPGSTISHTVFDNAMDAIPSQLNLMLGEQMTAVEVIGWHSEDPAITGGSSDDTFIVLESSRNKPLTTLRVEVCQMNDISVRSLSKLLKNNQLQCLSIVPRNPSDVQLQRLLPGIASQENLRALEIALWELNGENQKILEQIFSKNSLRKLGIHYHFTHELCHVMISQFPHMDALMELQLKPLKISNDHEFERCLDAASHLRLERFFLGNWFSSKTLDISQDSFNTLCNNVDKWCDLRALVFDTIQFNGQTDTARNAEYHHSASVQKLLCCIAGCRKLKVLSLRRMQIGDGEIAELCQMLGSLHELEELDLYENRFSGDSWNKLSGCLRQRPKRMNILNIKRASSHPDQEALRRLDENCHYVLR